MCKSIALSGRAQPGRVTGFLGSIIAQATGCGGRTAASVLALGLVAAGAHAATINVTTTNQEVNINAGCSLQEAIFAVNFQSNKAIDPSNPNGPPITTGCTAGNGIADTIVLAAGQVYQVSGIINDPFNFAGMSANPMLIRPVIIEGNGARLERVGGLNIRAFVVGAVPPGTTVPSGGAGTPYDGTGSLTIRNLHIKGFSAKGGDGHDGGGGGMGAGGAIYNLQTLVVENSTFENNSATGGAGGTAGTGADGGGGGGGLGGNGGGASGGFNAGHGGGGGRGNGANGAGGVNGAGGGGGGTVNDGAGSTGGFNCGGNAGAGAACAGGGGGGGSGGVPSSPGGSGGYGGGGGGGGASATVGNAGGNGGFGGGGGAGATNFSGGTGGAGGNGGFGGGGAAGGAGGTTGAAGAGGLFAGNADNGSATGGGGAGLGGAIFNDGGNVTIRNSTFTGNIAVGGAGGGGSAGAGNLAGGAIFSRNGSLTALNSTFSGNAADTNGGAILVLGDGQGTATVIVRNTILANNGPEDGKLSTANGGAVSPAGSGNLIMLNAGGTGAIPGVVSTANPLLGPLQINAPGSTPTMAITNTSPAYNGGDNTNCLATDQRGVARPAFAPCDIGAYELAVASPTIATSATALVVVGNAIGDTATLTGGITPTGNITFNVYGPNDATCTGPSAFSSSNPVNGSAAATSGTFTPTQAGTYRWIASYPGDANNNPVAGACNNANETTLVSKATPTMATTASAAVAVSSSISDSAALAAGFNPTGTITFTLFGPNNATCTGTPVLTSTLPVNGNGTYASGALVTSLAGTYRWIASYSGDPNNNPVTGACGAPGESVDVSKAAPVVTTSAAPSGSALIGASLSDTATLAGGVNPTGTIIFRLFGPNDPGCSGTPVFTSAAVPVNGNGSYASDSFTPTATGIYSWIASYSGDANNSPAADTCALPQETIQLVPLIPALGPLGLLLLLLGLAAAGGIALRRIR